MGDISSYDRWHRNGFNLAEIIVIHEGPDALGRSYVDGRHQHRIKLCDTAEEAERLVAEFNGAPCNRLAPPDGRGIALQHDQNPTQTTAASGSGG